MGTSTRSGGSPGVRPVQDRQEYRRLTCRTALHGSVQSRSRTSLPRRPPTPCPSGPADRRAYRCDSLPPVDLTLTFLRLSPTARAPQRMEQVLFVVTDET